MMLASDTMGVLDFIANRRSDRKIKKLLRGATTYTLATFPEGTFGRVIGRVRPHRARVLEAPLTGRLCAYYSIAIRTTVAPWTSRGGNEYTTIADEQNALAFELLGDTDRAVIDPEDAWISSGFDATTEDLADPRAGAIVRRLGIVARPLLIQEAVLEIDEWITVFGAPVREPDHAAPSGEAGYRDALPLHLRFTGTANFPLVIRDDLQSLS